MAARRLLIATTLPFILAEEKWTAASARDAWGEVKLAVPELGRGIMHVSGKAGLMPERFPHVTVAVANATVHVDHPGATSDVRRNANAPTAPRTNQSYRANLRESSGWRGNAENRQNPAVCGQSMPTPDTRGMLESLIHVGVRLTEGRFYFSVPNIRSPASPRPGRM
jgi:hypothetical protein